MAADDSEVVRPRTITNASVWDRIDHLEDTTRDARHAQNGLFQRTIFEQSESIRRVITDEAKETRDLVSAVEIRVRALETGFPSSLGGRLGDAEKWMAVIQSTNLPERVDRIESTLDKFGGTLTSIKVIGTILGVLNAAVILWATLTAGRTP